MAQLTRGELKDIKRRQSPADLKYLLALLQRDGEITLEKDEGKTKSAEEAVE